MNIRKLSAALLAAVMAVPAFAAGKVTTQSVVDMLGKGYTSEIIINYVEGADDVALTSELEDIDALMAAGADPALISFVQKYAKKDKEGKTGIYWWNTSDGKPQKVNLVSIEQKTSKLGGGLLGAAVGVAGTVAGVATGSGATIAGSWIAGDVLSTSGFKSDKLYIPGEHAHLKVNTTEPVFRFTLPQDDSFSPSDWVNLWLGAVQSPNEFQLIRLESKGKGEKCNRAFPANLKWGTMGFSTQNTSAMKNLVDFEVRQVNNKVYEIYFPSGIEPGEYAFFYRNATHPLVKDHLSAFDFTVTD